MRIKIGCQAAPARRAAKISEMPLLFT